MNRDAFILLLTGLLVGFLATYLLVRDRDLGPLVIRGPAPVGATPTGTAANFENEMRLIRDLESDLNERPNDFQLIVDLANLYFDVQNFGQALAYYERAVAIRPEDPDLRTDMGTALYYSGRVDEALAQFERSLAARPGHPQTLFNMGVVLLEQRNDREGAIAMWERLIQMNPGYPQAGMVQEQIDRLRSQP